MRHATAFILRILFRPSSVKCALFSNNKATLPKSSKSNNLLPNGKYSLKKGIIRVFRSENLVHLYFTISSEYLLMIPQLKKEVKVAIVNSSLICWAISNPNLTWYPTLWWVDLNILTKKEPSPDVNPAIHIPCGIDSAGFHDLSWFGLVERVSAKASWISSDKPKFKDDFILIISFNPSTVKCLLASIIEIIDFHNL